jgi:predicted dehydrogenase
VNGRTVELGAHAGVEDVAVATLVFASGAVATLTSVWHQVLSRPSNRRLEVLCEDGMVEVVPEWAGPLTVTTTRGAEAVACPPPAWLAGLEVEDRWRGAVAAYAPQAHAFLTAVATGAPPAPGLPVAVAAHRLADAAYRSAAAGGTPITL